MSLHKATFIGVGTIVALLLAGAPVLAKPDTQMVPATNNKSNRTVTIPKHAIEVADHVFSLGTATDPVTGKSVEGLMIVDRHDDAKAEGKEMPARGRVDKCYAFLASGAKWKTTEDYVVDPTNVDGLSDTFVKDSIAAAVNTWDTQVNTDMFGTENETVTVNGADEVAPDGNNEVLFADIDSPGVVGLTIVWGVFSGKPNARQLVEWDQVYDDVDYNFGDADTLGTSVMDFLNVTTHEIGHSAGMGHPSDSCTQETMYRFVSPGETLKRDLNTGDIAGVTALYK